MDLERYFANATGTGLLATSNAEGEVNLAVYGKPHVLEEGLVAFGTGDRLTLANLRANPKAAYAYVEPGYRGVRLYLEKVREETDGPLLAEIRRGAEAAAGPGAGQAVKAVVVFRVVRSLALVGPGPARG
ncbi:pyridoxamine 5'-phosphate oxidase family protein [Deferrisoma sp.]|nr:MAG: pyridoxamine 5'-phosphate oxidase family protein [Candidatus Dadabacteria bacterium]